jgi:hypothetical protein
VFAFAVWVTSCAPEVTTAATPLVVCHTVLSHSVAGPVLFDAMRPLPTIPHYSVGERLYFRVARGCYNGSHVRWVPSSAAHLVKVARATDGLPVAVALKPRGRCASLPADRDARRQRRGDSHR